MPLGVANGLKILILLDSSGIGGLEAHTSALASSLQSKGCKVGVVLFVTSESAASDATTDFFARRGVLPLITDKTDTLTAAQRLDGIVGEYNIWHSHTGYTAEICDVLGPRFGRKYVQTVHGGHFVTESSSGDSIGQIIFISNELKDLFSARHPDKPSGVVIPNGIDVPETCTNTNEFFTITYASRIDPDHRQSLSRFLSGMLEVSKIQQDIRAEIFGTGRDVDWLNDAINITNTKVGRQLVSYKGFSACLMESLVKSHVVVGVGRVVLEGLALGRPAFVLGQWGYGGPVTKANASDLAEFNFTGRNVLRDFRSDIFAKDVCWLYKDHQAYNTLSDFSRLFVLDGYSRDRVTMLTLQAYQKCLETATVLGAPNDGECVSELELKENTFLMIPDFLAPNQPWKSALRPLVNRFDSIDPVTIVFLLLPSCGLSYEEAITELKRALPESDVTVDVLVLTDIVNTVSILALLRQIRVYIRLDSLFDKVFGRKAFQCGCDLVEYHMLGDYLDMKLVDLVYTAESR